mmetsp:Transcript_95100/g.251242  ORF Transcript_95100/g.251242 Transcript_95100/m.251242 type:complete len:469 (+) Transcript_95100:239-1645(+)
MGQRRRRRRRRRSRGRGARGCRLAGRADIGLADSAEDAPAPVLRDVRLLLGVVLVQHVLQAGIQRPVAELTGEPKGRPHELIEGCRWDLVVDHRVLEAGRRALGGRAAELRAVALVGVLRPLLLAGLLAVLPVGEHDALLVDSGLLSVVAPAGLQGEIPPRLLLAVAPEVTVPELLVLDKEFRIPAPEHRPGLGTGPRLAPVVVGTELRAGSAGQLGVDVFHRLHWHRVAGDHEEVSDRGVGHSLLEQKHLRLPHLAPGCAHLLLKEIRGERWALPGRVSPGRQAVRVDVHGKLQIGCACLLQPVRPGVLVVDVVVSEHQEGHLDLLVSLGLIVRRLLPPLLRVLDHVHIMGPRPVEDLRVGGARRMAVVADIAILQAVPHLHPQLGLKELLGAHAAHVRQRGVLGHLAPLEAHRVVAIGHAHRASLYPPPEVVVPRVLLDGQRRATSHQQRRRQRARESHGFQYVQT